MRYVNGQTTFLEQKERSGAEAANECRVHHVQPMGRGHGLVGQPVSEFLINVALCSKKAFNEKIIFVLHFPTSETGNP